MSYVPLVERDNAPLSYSAWAWQKCRRFSRLASQTAILGLDAIFFAGKVSNSVPDIVTRTSLTLLSGTGLIGIPYNLDLIYKTIIDTTFGKGAKNYPVMILAALKVIELVSSLGLTVASFAASIEGVEGNNSTQGSIYNAMTPIGEIGLALSLLDTLSFMWLNHKTIRMIKEDENAYLALDAYKGGDSSRIKLASQIRFSMDKDTLGTLLSQLPEENCEIKEEMMSYILQNIDTQQKINLGGQLALMILGYILMAIEKYYTPNSVTSASINLGVASLYTLKILIENIREIKQRNRLKQIHIKTLSIEQANNEKMIQVSRGVDFSVLPPR